MYHSLFTHSSTEGHLDCFQFFGNYEQTCCKHSCECFCVDISFQNLWVNIKEHDFCVLWWEYAYFCKKPTNCPPGWLYHFAFPSAMNEISCCSTSSLAGVVSLLNFGHSNRYVVASQCCSRSIIVLRFIFRSMMHF